MVKLTINNIPVEVPEGTTVLNAAKSIGINIPTLCYLEGINDIGACRVCVVELKGKEKLISSCNTYVDEGMEIYTNTQKVRDARKINVELILSQHDCNCAFCIRSGNCALQKLSNDLGIFNVRYEKDVPSDKFTKDFELIRNPSKCIKCMRCVQVCDKVQGMNIWDIAGTGTRTTVDVSYSRLLKKSDCALCGQCITHCPVGALSEKSETDKAFEAIANKDKITVVQIAPAVRVGWGDGLGIDREFATVKRLVSALRKLGFNYIFDTDFSADLTIMEEGHEFIHRFTHKDRYKLPMFTSCCPGWIRTIKARYPEMVGQLSTAKSPQQMFGAVAKSYYAKLLGVDADQIFSVSIMPCLAKKSEAALPTMNDAGSGQDVDLVLTTREIDRMIRIEQINPNELEEEEFDMPLGVGSGAGVIFGATGGVMEAALRSAYFMMTGENPDPDAFKEIRGMDGWKEAKFEIKGMPITVAIASGLGNTQKLMDAIKKGKVNYDFVEIMACPGGCAGGGGQPIVEGEELAGIRGEALYGLDKVSEIRFSHENPAVKKLYSDYLGSPGTEAAHKLLHTNHKAWDMPSN